MTGYAYREISEENISLSVEIRSLNSRYLEISVNTPSWLSSVEPAVRDIIGKACYRGKVEAAVRIWENNIPVKVSVNLDAAKAYKSAIRALAKELKIKEKPGLALLLSLDGVLEIEKERDNSRYWNIIEPVLLDAISAFNESRAKEGAHTEEDILKSVSRIEASLEIVSSFAKTMEDSIKETISARFAELLGDKTDENRVMAETAALLVKATISEEIVRLGAHLSEFRDEVARNGHPGKKLDFLCQEINREVNTIGSKSSILEVSRAVIEMKDALENVREQLRNVE
jgi:uncharacterized protein (TIGR00255 family)